MSAFTVLMSSSVPPGIRGALNQWMIEVLPGMYVGRPSARVREYLWDELSEALERDPGAYAALVCSAPTEQGFLARTVGEHRYDLRDFDGLQLVTVTHQSRRLSEGDEGVEEDPGW